MYCVVQGFVSNKTSDQGDSSVDPYEALLYTVFVANSERMTVADVATILGVELSELQVNNCCLLASTFLWLSRLSEHACTALGTTLVIAALPVCW